MPLRTDPEYSSFLLRSTQKTIQLKTTYEYHDDTQIFVVKYLYTFPDGATKDTALVIKLYFPAEMQMFLSYNGFHILKVYGGHDLSTVDEQSAKYVVLARTRIESAQPETIPALCSGCAAPNTL